MSNSKLIFILILILTLNVFAQDEKPKVFRYSDNSGNEIVVTGQSSEADSEFGFISIKNSHHNLKKYKEGKLIFETDATIGKTGLRMSSASRLAGKSKHLLLIGSSSIFGEGMKDDETLAHKINLRSKVYEAYPIAFYGYGPQHIWLELKKELLPKKIIEKKGKAIIFTHESELHRFFGSIETLGYTFSFPFVEETENGHFINRGSFRNAGKWWQRLVCYSCTPFDFCKNFLFNKTPRELTQNDYAVIGRLYQEIENMYRQQFDVEDIKIVSYSNDEEIKKFANNTKLEIYQFLVNQKERRNDGHLTKKGVESLSDFLFNSNLVN